MSVSGTVSLVAATLLTGLTAGLFAAFAYAVMPGLARADDRTAVVAMQRVNESIRNGWFAPCFLGAPVCGVAAAVLHGAADRRDALPWIVGGLALYAAALVITVAVNLPLNAALAAVGDPDRHADLAARRRFEPAWVRWNVARAVASTAGFGSLTWALVLHGGPAT